MNTLCTHTVYNRECEYCLGVISYCGDAMNEGYVDFDINSDWDTMQAYYDKYKDYEPEDPERDEIDPETEDKINYGE